MAKVRRANVILTIKDSEVERYLDLGYDIIDEMGNVIRESIPTDVGTLRRAFVEHTKTIADLKAEIDNLKKARSRKTKE